MTESEKEKLFDTAFEENKDKIYRLCYTTLTNKNDVEDLFQEVMVNIWRNLESFRHESKISTWIYRITVNTAFLHNKKFRKKNSIFSNIDASELVQIHSNEDHFKDNMDEELKLLHKAIAELKKQDRAIIGLYLEELSYDEISEIVGISENYVGVKINRIKTQLAKKMEGISNV